MASTPESAVRGPWVALELSSSELAVTVLPENGCDIVEVIDRSTGVDVMVPAPSETYQMTTGTSVAAAHVSGVAALLIERHPEVSAQTILEVLTSSATHLNPKGRDNLFGWGLVDPAAGLAELDSRMEDSQVASNRPASSKPALPAQASTPQMPRGVLAPIRGE